MSLGAHESVILEESLSTEPSCSNPAESPTPHLQVGSLTMHAFAIPVTRFFGMSTNRPVIRGHQLGSGWMVRL